MISVAALDRVLGARRVISVTSSTQVLVVPVPHLMVPIKSL